MAINLIDYNIDAFVLFPAIIIHILISLVTLALKSDIYGSHQRFVFMMVIHQNVTFSGSYDIMAHLWSGIGIIPVDGTIARFLLRGSSFNDYCLSSEMCTKILKLL
jgi:hypothetical protein